MNAVLIYNTKCILGVHGMSPDKFKSNGRPKYDKYKENGNVNQTCYISEMTPLTELPSNDDLTSNDVESWLETSSKYHSCEIVDMDWNIYLYYLNMFFIYSKHNNEIGKAAPHLWKWLLTTLILKKYIVHVFIL